MSNGCCLDSLIDGLLGLIGKIIGIIIACLFALILFSAIYGITDKMILVNVESNFLVGVLFIVSYAIRGFLTYLMFAGIISPRVKKFESGIYSTDLPSIFRTVSSVIVILAINVIAFLLCIYEYTDNENTGNNIDSFVYNSTGFFIVIIVVLVASIIAAAVVRYRKIENEWYEGYSKRKHANELSESSVFID